MACASGRWGDIPLEPNTVYVDQTYAGGASDGSETRPWTTVSDAVAVAPSGALIAIARGTYVEDVIVTGKAVRLWGVCPGEVAILSTGQQPGICPPAALCLAQQPPGMEVHGLALGGASTAVTVSGAEQVLLDRVWVHDAAGRGVALQSTVGPASATLRDSLVEGNEDFGVFVYGSQVSIERSVVRGTLPRGDLLSGRGISVQNACTQTSTDIVCAPTTRGAAVVTGSVIEQNHDVGIGVSGSDAIIEASVVRANLPRVLDQLSGRGVGVQVPCIETTEGVACDTAERGNVSMTSSLVAQNHETGFVVAGSDAVIDGSVVRDTLPQASDQDLGRGIVVQPVCGETCDPTTRATAAIARSLVARNHEFGVYVSGSDAALDASAVRATLPRAFDQTRGRGLSIQALCEVESGAVLCTNPSGGATMSVTGSLIEENHDYGIVAMGSDVTIDGSVVRDTQAQPADGLFGDGIGILGVPVLGGRATLTRTLVEDSARAGIANFGALVELGATRVICATIDVTGETVANTEAVFDDGGDNLCGCPEADMTCKVVNAGLQPPTPVVDGGEEED
jgi:hypothetical protein